MSFDRIRHRLEGTDAIRALSWDQVAAIRQRFAALNPYDPSKIGGSVLRLEDQLPKEQRVSR